MSEHDSPMRAIHSMRVLRAQIDAETKALMSTNKSHFGIFTRCIVVILLVVFLLAGVRFAFS